MRTGLKIRLLLVGRTQRGPVQEAMGHYLDRAGRMATVVEVVVPEAGGGAPDHQRRLEGQRLLEAIEPGERVVALDETGRQLTSKEFAMQLGRWRDASVKQIAFVVGGAYGLDEPVRQRADLVLSLSAMTFPHQLVRLIFAEQLYRAFTIMAGAPYHH